MPGSGGQRRHRWSPNLSLTLFVGLGRLVRGDRIILTTTFGQNLTYVVSGTPQAVSPADVGVLSYFGDNRVTLTTCNPEFSLTSTTGCRGDAEAARWRADRDPSSTSRTTWSIPPSRARTLRLLPAVGVVGVPVASPCAVVPPVRHPAPGNRGKWLILGPLVGGRPLPAFRHSDEFSPVYRLSRKAAARRQVDDG